MPTSSSHRPDREERHLWLLAAGTAVLTSGLLLALVTGARPDLPYDGGAGRPATVQPADGGPELPAFVVEPTTRFEPAQEPAERTVKRPVRRHPATGVPVELVVPKLGMRAPVVAIDVDDGVLVPPSDPKTLGWWAAGAKPGALLGGALVTGHTVSTGGGAFDDLDTLKVGDRLRVRTRSGEIRYVVSAVSVYRKASLARHAERVFSQAVRGRLVLVTCEDWTGERYLSNAVVFADPVPVQKPDSPSR